MALGTKLVYMIEEIDNPKINQLANHYKCQRPTIPPPDPITFQQQKPIESEK